MNLASIFGKMLGAVSSHTPPKADEGAAWDGSGAVNRLKSWAGGPDKDKISWNKFRTGFAWYDAASPEDFGSYKLPHHDIVDGQFVVVWRGVAAAMGALMGSRGGVSIPASDKSAVHSHLATHYKQFSKEVPALAAPVNDYLDNAFPAPMGGIVEPTDDDLQSINKQSKEPLVASDVYVFPAVISTNLLNSYDFRMADSTLDNFVADAQNSPCLVGHDTSTLPIGRSFAAERITNDEIDGVAVRAYFLRNCQIPGGGSTDDIARLIQAGISTDISVGFGGSELWFRCSICDKDMMSSDCPHIPGVEYDAVRAFAWLENAHLREFSLVYKGADPGAVILCPESVRLKAEHMALAGTLSANQIEEAEFNLGITLPRSQPDNIGTAQEDGTMNAKALLEKLRSSLGDKCPSVVKAIDAMRLAVKDDAPADDIVNELGAMLCVQLSAATLASEILEKLNVDSVEAVDQVTQLAEIGKQYRTDLITQTLEAGVRAYGEDFKKELHEKLLNEPGRSLEDIKTFLAQFEADAVKRLGEGGRQTTPGASALGSKRTFRDYNAAEFDALPEDEQKRLIEEYRPKTDKKE